MTIKRLKILMKFISILLMTTSLCASITKDLIGEDVKPNYYETPIWSSLNYFQDLKNKKSSPEITHEEGPSELQQKSNSWFPNWYTYTSRDEETPSNLQKCNSCLDKEASWFYSTNNAPCTCSAKILKTDKNNLTKRNSKPTSLVNKSWWKYWTWLSNTPENIKTKRDVVKPKNNWWSWFWTTPTPSHKKSIEAPKIKKKSWWKFWDSNSDENESVDVNKSQGIFSRIFSPYSSYEEKNSKLSPPAKVEGFWSKFKDWFTPEYHKVDVVVAEDDLWHFSWWNYIHSYFQPKKTPYNKLNEKTPIKMMNSWIPQFFTSRNF